MSAPLVHIYNLARLGNAGDDVRLEADAAQRASIAALAEVLSLARFIATVTLKKAGANRFVLGYRLDAEVAQACVVTLEPVIAHIARDFTRELHFSGPGRRPPEAADLDLSVPDEDEPEEIDNLHYDLAGPVLEEFLLALDPYPRCPGVAFDPAAVGDPPPESPFAVLKSLKSKT
ncbi:MAG TPA: DUF177 domain-containing protein [Rhizomicrobium sp.]|nr:DUF177 domain-containing protein [Rhizomicrobium sp.]